MQLKSQKMRKLAPELDPLRIGTGWTKEDLGKVQVIVESTYGDSHPGSGHLNILEEEVRKGIAEEGGFGARYHCTEICDGERQGTDGINYSLASREMIANMIEIHANATPFDAGVYLSSCDKGVPGNLIGLARVDIPSVFVPGGTMNAGPEMRLWSSSECTVQSLSAARLMKKNLTGRNAMPARAAVHVLLSEQLLRCRSWQRRLVLHFREQH